MPNCPHCNAEVDVDQKVCAWCGKEIAGAPSPQTSRPPSQPSTPAPMSTPPAGSQPPANSVQKSQGPVSRDARELAKRGDLEGALRLYRGILENNPNDEEALFGIGGIHFKKSDYKKAVEFWLKLKVVNPSYPKIDQWIAESRKHLSPSSLSSTQPPSTPQSSSPTPPPPSQTHVRQPPPAPPVESYQPPPSAGEGEDDWQRQSVRLDHIDEEALEEPPPAMKEKIQEPEKEEVEEESPERPESAPPLWAARLGWGLLLLYTALIWGIYYF